MSVSAREAEQVLEHRRRAEDLRALAAEHRARAHELRAAGGVEQEVDGVDSDTFLHAGIEEVLAEIAELRAAGFEQRAVSSEALVGAEAVTDRERDELLALASAAVIRAAEFEAEAISLRDDLAPDIGLHDVFVEAATARARAIEQSSPPTVVEHDVDRGAAADSSV